MKTRTLLKDKVNIITLGCSKNLVDSENIVTQLAANEIDVTHEDYNADANIVVVNTCGFIDLAKEESVNTILEYADIKKEGGIDKLYVTGCLSQRYKDNLEEEIPEVDAFFGTMELPALLEKFDVDYQHELLGQRAITTPPHYAYLKISEGCNRTCSFCAIPLMRGKHISRSIDDLVVEAKNLAKRGVKELMRLHYAYPSKFPLEIFDVMARQPKVNNYLDIPLQHANNDVLERMRRQITQSEQRELIKIAKEKVPDIAIRTTFLVGFPGETEEEFQDLLDFVADMKFERVGVFQYSHEEDTSAHDFPDDIDPEDKADRANRLMEVQQQISYDKNQEKIGQTLKVLVDRKEGGYFVGRTEFDSPEVDNEVLIPAADNYVRIGDFAMVHITDAEDYDLYGKVVS